MVVGAYSISYWMLTNTESSTSPASTGVLKPASAAAKVASWRSKKIGSGCWPPDSLMLMTPMMLTPASADPVHVGSVRALWRAVGARTVEMEANEHDRIVARVSHLPQMLSYALAASLADENRRSLYALAANGLRDTTRLALSDASMWKAIAKENKVELLDSMDALSAVWARLRDAIENGDTDELDRIIESAASFRRGLEAE